MDCYYVHLSAPVLDNLENSILIILMVQYMYLRVRWWNSNQTWIVSLSNDTNTLLSHV